MVINNIRKEELIMGQIILDSTLVFISVGIFVLLLIVIFWLMRKFSFKKKS